MIPKVAEAGYKQLICFSGTKRGKDNETGLEKLRGGAEANHPNR